LRKLKLYAGLAKRAFKHPIPEALPGTPGGRARRRARDQISRHRSRRVRTHRQHRRPRRRARGTCVLCCGGSHCGRAVTGSARQPSRSRWRQPVSPPTSIRQAAGPAPRIGQYGLAQTNM